MFQRPVEACGLYWKRRYDLVRFALLFRLFEAFVFTPLAALIGRLLSGVPVVDSTDLVGFVLSPRGFFATFLGATLLITIRLLEQGGLSAITLGAIGGRRVTSPQALRILIAQLPRILSVAALILAAGLALLAPLLLVAGLLSMKLLAQHDINYYAVELPPDFLIAATVIVVIALPTIIAAGWLAVRWRFVIPVILCEPGNAFDVLRSSAKLVHGHWKRSASAWIFTALFTLLLGLLASWLGRLCSTGATLFADNGINSQVVIFATLIVGRTLLTGFITTPGPCVAAGVFAILYRDFRREREPDWAPEFAIVSADTTSSRMLAAGRALIAVLPLIMSGLALVSTVVGMGVIYSDHPIAVTAHRGGTQRSIENTMGAIQEAIDAGAQYAEIDVQMSRDEVLVLAHDSDFSRQAGVPRKVWEMDYEEIRQLRLTNSASPEIPSDYVPTFDEVLEKARGRIRLNVELKYYRQTQPRLAERVVEAVRAREMAGEVIIQSLHYAGLEEARRAAPEVPVGYLFSVNAREPQRLDVNFLSVQLSRVSGPFINAAHRRHQEVHVWTVDKPRDMERLIDLGVDNLITNRPEEALELVREHNLLTPPERALHRIRAWLVE